MKTADEMFEELGYEKYYEDEYIAEFRDNNVRQIAFIKVPKRILVNQHITIQELNVINEKVKELGWLDEN